MSKLMIRKDGKVSSNMNTFTDKHTYVYFLVMEFVSWVDEFMHLFIHLNIRKQT